MLRLTTALVLSLAPLSLRAEVPRVLADTIPVHSLVAQVMGDLGSPDLLLPPGVSVHDYQMRPSDAARLSGADVVIWTGAGLTPWLADPVGTLAPDALHLELLATEGWDALPLRAGTAFDHGHDHDHAEETAGDDGHDHGGDHDHAEEDGHDHGGDQDHNHGGDHDSAAAEGHDHAAEHGDHGHDHAHAAGGTDPHAWLSPAVAAVWLGHIAAALAEADPANAATYRTNAAAAADRLADLQSSLAADLAPLSGRAFVVPHDAYQYFESAFALPAAGAVALSDAAAPGPARIADLRDRVEAGDIACILTDPQTNPEWSALLTETGLARTARVDADGTDIPPGPDAHAAILTGIAAALTACLSDG
jgi:zinc transport system substrate-binding protein